MKSVRISEHLRAVERGAEIEVLERDRPVARIVGDARNRAGVATSR